VTLVIKKKEKSGFVIVVSVYSRLLPDMSHVLAGSFMVTCIQEKTRQVICNIRKKGNGGFCIVVSVYVIIDSYMYMNCMCMHDEHENKKMQPLI